MKARTGKILRIVAPALVMCVSIGTLAIGDPNQVQQPDANTVSETPKPPSGDLSKPQQAAKLTKSESQESAEKGGFDWTKAIPWIITGVASCAALGMLVLRILERRRLISDAVAQEKAKIELQERAKKERQQENVLTLEDCYKSVLCEQLGTIQVRGSREIAPNPVDLLDTFVSLDITAMSVGECREGLERKEMRGEGDRKLSPESVLKRAFKNHRMLLVLGDAGSGKTTLLQYYAMLCLTQHRCRALGFHEAPLPLYFALRDLKFEDGNPCLLHDCLNQWAKKHYKDIPTKTFLNWLQDQPTLILLDGLDEICDLEKRRKACEWIDDTAADLSKAHIVVTCRWTGYRALEHIQLGFDHLTAEIRDFSPEQQSQFLRKWFVAAYLKEPRDEDMAGDEWERSQTQQGLDRANAIINFLSLDQNKAVRQLAAVPMLLQIVAIIWKERENLPQGRADLYDAAVKYLLDYRDRRRRLDPLLTAEQALRVLCPVSLWMQEKLQTDEVDRDKLHAKMQPTINTMDDTLEAEDFCANLRDRAGLIADYGDNAYIFRHKSFREYLAGVELAKVTRDPQRLKGIVNHFGDDWWDESLRFYMSEADADLFDGFMDALFASEVSRDLDQKQQNLLRTIVCEATQVRVDSLVRRLNDGRVTDAKKRYILDCLKAVGKQEARRAVSEFAENQATSAAGAYAAEIVAEAEVAAEILIEARVARKIVGKTKETPQAAAEREAVKAGDVFVELPESFRNIHEYNAEYIHIPDGSFEYSVTERSEAVADIYFAKYPVTNKRYRRFMSYLRGKDDVLSKILPVESFLQRMLEFATKTRDFEEYLAQDRCEWADKLRSRYDLEKHFRSEAQPVVGVSWFDARAYCFWLTALAKAGAKGPPADVPGVFRLPTELEWEWAAGGGKRKYPWPPEKGPPSDRLANFGQHVGATTPVGRYPEGATPQGLMDMAGNVWEWMENWYEGYVGKYRSLRGGSWNYVGNDLRCAARLSGDPGVRYDCGVGFRVILSQS